MILKSYHVILGVPANATKDEVKKAFRSLAHIHHPDKGGDAEKFKEISLAYTEMIKYAPETRVSGDSKPFDRPTTTYDVKVTYHYYTSWNMDLHTKARKKAMEDIADAMVQQNKRAQEQMNNMRDFFNGKW